MTELDIVTRAMCKLQPPKVRPGRVAVHPGIIVHCTGGIRPNALSEAVERWRRCQHGHMAAPDWRDVEDPETGKVHRKNFGGNGWSDIGYDFGVTPDGSILEGRGWNVLGAHAGKGWNKWLGIVVLGKGTEITPAEADAIRSIYLAHRERGGGPRVIPHNAVSNKSCPGPAVTAWLKNAFPEDFPGGVAA